MEGTDPRWSTKSDFDSQSIIFPGTENGERVRINKRLLSPESGADDYMNWLIGTIHGTDFTTIYDLWQESARVYADRPFLGDRKHGGDDFRYKTYAEIATFADQIGTAIMKSCGVKPKDSCNVGIFSGNNWQWTVCSISAHNFNWTLVPMYDTLGDQAMKYIADQCEFNTIFIDNEARAKKFVDSIAGSDSCCKHIVAFDQISEETVAKAADAGMTVHQFDALCENCGDIAEHNPPKADDTFCICYTSGTTGDPKGVVLTQANWLADLSTVQLFMRQLTSEDKWLSYLPAAHVFERMVQTMYMYKGASIGFFGGDPRQLIADAGALGPTFFGGVPRVWNKIYAKLMAAKGESKVKGWLIDWALRNKMKMVESGINRNDTIYDKIVFKKIQALLGGKVNGGACGAAPMKNDVMNTIRAALGTYVTEAYGQTECAAAATATLLNDPRASIGAPGACCAVKLCSVPEMEYFASEDKGEICIKGLNVMARYFKNPTKTAETIDSDGWLHTGDVGMWTKYGTLQIIDRAKHIFKLAQGEYVAPEKIENVFVMLPAIAQIYVYGESLKNGLVCVVMPDPETFENWAGKKGSMEELCQDESLKIRLMKELNTHGRACGLKGFEIPRAITLNHELMSVENNLLTPTMKAKRPQIKKAFQPMLDKMYENVE